MENSIKESITTYYKILEEILIELEKIARIFGVNHFEVLGRSSREIPLKRSGNQESSCQSRQRESLSGLGTVIVVGLNFPSIT